MLLYELGTSRSMRIHWILREVGMEYQSQRIELKKGEGRSEEYLKVNPFGKVPAIKDGDFILYESSAIINYICEKFPEKELIPKPATRQRALYDQWMAVCLHELESPIWYAMKAGWYYPKDIDLKELPKAARMDGRRTLKVLENHLKDKTYMLETGFSGLDVMFGSTMTWVKEFGWLEGLSNCLAYHENVVKRDSYPNFLYEKK